jgi:hypothetical protein
MTMPAEVVVETTAPDTTSYVDWPAIFAGIVLASGISLLLLAFGSALGLSFTDFRAREGASPVWIAIAAASWLIWVQVSSFMAGGYVTGRFRRRHHDATEDEVDIRDGTHGLLVWAGALILGAALAVGGIGAAANAVGSAAATLTNAASNVAGGAAGALDPNAYFVDTLFRPTASGEAAAAPAADAAATETPAATTEAPAADATAAAATTPTPAAMSEPSASTPAPAEDDTAVRAEAGRIFASAAMGELPEADRTYLAQLVADRTGMSDEEATARVAEVEQAMATARNEAAEAAEAARKAGIIAAFITAASILVSAIGAFWAAQKGGQHRDSNTVFPGVFRRF